VYSKGRMTSTSDRGEITVAFATDLLFTCVKYRVWTTIRQLR
jgi:hypothetical protein